MCLEPFRKSTVFYIILIDRISFNRVCFIWIWNNRQLGKPDNHLQLHIVQKINKFMMTL